MNTEYLMKYQCMLCCIQEFADALKQLEVLSVIDHTKSGGLKLGNHKKLQILLSNLLLPFLQGYISMCHILKQVCCLLLSYTRVTY